MKTFFLSFPKALGLFALTVAGVLAMPLTGQAKPKHHHDDDDHHHHHHSSSYYSYPRSSYVLALGTGYAGRGYYYGPPGVPYYYETPGVRYYATRSVVPREYLNSSYGTGYSYDARSGSTDAAVQSELARRGYYHGSIDGSIGPMSSRAIARYQADHGLPVTGSVTSSLLRSLGI